jgi:superfamily II DNA or RNA helicase
MKVIIERINNHTYSFRLSDNQGIKKIAKALTFPNPNPISKNRTIEFFNKTNMTFGLGMLTNIIRFLEDNGIKYQLSDYEYEPINMEIDSRMSGNYIHQRHAVEAFYKRRFGIIVVPTRGGKTFIASEICRIFLAKEKGNFMFCVDNVTLFSQAVNDIKEFFTAYGGIEVGEIRAGKVDTTHRVTVAMIQTIQRTLSNSCADKAKKRGLQNYLKELQFLCVDEIHDNCSKSKLKIYRKCKNLDYTLCLSATPYRSETELENLKLQEWSGDIIYRISEKTLRERGVLSDYRVFELLVDHNELLYNFEDDDYQNLRQHLIFNSDVRNRYILKVIDIVKRLELKTLLLFQSVEHGEAIAEMSKLPFISGRDKTVVREQRKRELLDNPHGGILLSSDIFKKGVTLPDVEVLLVCDNNKEAATTIQRKGRVLGVTREKNRSLIIDFVDVYDAYFSEHSEARLNTYIESIGEENVGILDTSSETCFETLENWIKKWFCL